MIKYIKILSRMAVHSLANDDFYAPSVVASLPVASSIRLISINGSDEQLLTGEQQETLKLRHNFTSISSYVFDDIGGDIWEAIVKRKGADRSRFVVFGSDMATSIMSSIDVFNESADDELLVIHCHAGISRSAAVGCAVAFHLGLDNREFIDMNPNIDPNKHILGVMLKEIGRSETSFNIWRSQRKRF
jgi:predicted protein tyrosine phosphatase